MTDAVSGIQGIAEQRPVQRAARREGPDGASFRERLHQQLRISGHAARRMKSRGLQLDPGAMDRLATAVEEAGVRGSSEALVLMDGVAFVVSVPNRTVITAHAGPGDRVYTNIDSTIVLGGE